MAAKNRWLEGEALRARWQFGTYMARLLEEMGEALAPLGPEWLKECRQQVDRLV